MDTNWDKYCTMSIVHFMAYPGAMSGEGAISNSVRIVAEDAFFSGIEITSIHDREERVAAKTIIESSNLRVAFGAQPIILMGKLNPNSLDEAERTRAIDALKNAIDEAVDVGAKRLAFLSGPDPGDAQRDAALEMLVYSTKELCEYGGERGVGLTCETFDRTVDKKALIGPCEIALEYATAVREEFPDFGLMYDLSHQPLLFEEVEHALALLAPYLVHVHVGNCVRDEGILGYGDLHPRFGWPGGCNDVAELAVFIRELFRVGYLGGEDGNGRPWVGFEVKPQSELERSEQLIASTKRVWQEAWARA